MKFTNIKYQGKRVVVAPEMNIPAGGPSQGRRYRTG
jgi:hypothetical protein